MLKLCIHPSGTNSAWYWTGARWRGGTSWVAPYLHPCTEQRAITDGTRTLLVSRERRIGTLPTAPIAVTTTPGGYDEALTELGGCAEDWTAVEIGPATAVRVITGHAGTAPVYLTVGRDRALHGSWDLADLRGHFDGTALNTREVGRRIALATRYTSATFWHGVQLLTERATAHYDDGILSVHHPEPAPHALARQLKPHADPVPQFAALLERVVSERALHSEKAAVQLSGGMDSTCVALALAAAGAKPSATGILLPGPAGRQQARRRAHIAAACGIRTDWTVRASHHLPLHPASPRMRAHGAPVSPYTDLYFEAMDASLDFLAQAGATTVYTGIGGDELAALTTREHPRRAGTGLPPQGWLGPAAREAAAAGGDLTPTTVVPETALTALASCAPMLLGHGLWPVHPLTDRRVVTYAEWMPVAWRKRKQLLRERIDRVGMPREVAYPLLRENFAPVAVRALRLHGGAAVRRMLHEGSPLIETELVDPRGLAAVADRFEEQRDAEQDREVIFVLVMDAALRAFS